MNDNEIHATVLDGVEEEKYWDDFNQKKAEKFIRSQKRGRGKPQNGRSSRKVPNPYQKIFGISFKKFPMKII